MLLLVVLAVRDRLGGVYAHPPAEVAARWQNWLSLFDATPPSGGETWAV